MDKLPHRKSVSLWTIWLLLLHHKVIASIPVITTPPSDAYAGFNKPHRFTCGYTSSDPANTHVSWYHNGTKKATQHEDPASKYKLEDSASLFLYSFEPQDIGWYYCNVTNSEGSAISSNATLSLSVMGAEFRRSPDSSYAATVGLSVTLHCQPPEGIPEPKVMWERDGKLIDHDQDPRFSIQSPPGNLVIRNVNKSDAASYVCIGNNPADEVKSDPAVLHVYEKPKIILSPSDYFVNAGGTAKFMCVARGDPEPNITWFKDNDLLVSARSKVLTDNSLEIYDIDTTDNGDYICEAHNPGGSDRASARLMVHTTPEFLVKPVTKTVGKGSLVTFRCVADGYPEPTISWTTNQDSSLVLYPRQSQGRLSVLVDGSLQISDSRPADDGEYQCIASNVAGRSTSTASL